MAVTIGNTSSSGEQVASSSYNWSHNSNGDYLVVGLALFNIAATVSGITFNGVALALLKTQNDGLSTRAELWGLANPDAGSHSIAVSLGSSITSSAGAVSASGVKQTGSTEAANGATGTGTSNASVAVTTVADNDVVIDCVCTSDTSITVGAGQTQQVNVAGSVGTVAMSTEGPKTPAGSVTMDWSGLGSLQPWTTVGIGLIPAPVSVDHTVAAGGGNWGTGATWVEGTVPTALDNCFANGTSGNFTIDAGAVGRSLDCTGFTGTLTHNAAVTCALGDGTAGTGNIALKLVAGMTYTKGHATSSAFSFVSTSATQQTIAAGGKTLGNVTINGAGSSYKLSAALTSAGTLTLTAGTFNDFSQVVTAAAFASSNANVRVLTAAGTWIINGTSGALWDCSTSTNLTVNATGMGITFSDTGGSDKSFDGGGKTWYAITVSGGGAGAFINKNSDTFAGYITVQGPKTWKITKTKTLTAAALALSGSLGNVITIDTEDGAGTATISCSTAVDCDYMNITRSVAAGSVPFYAGANSTDGGTNTNWTFTVRPTPLGSSNFYQRLVGGM